MASVIKIEQIDFTNASSGTVTLANTLPSVNSAFVCNTNTRNMSAGPTGNTGNAGPDELSLGVAISSTTQLTVTNPFSISQKYMGQVWRYTGAASGIDEFIVRGRFVVTLGANVENNSVAVSGITNRNKCVCFITGKTINQTSQNNWQEAMAIAYIDASNNLVVSRQDTNATAMDVYVTVVEFTGGNWTVGYHRGSFSTASKTLVNDSRGNTGSTFNVGNWSAAMVIQAQLEGDSGGNNAIEDRSYTATAGVSTTTISTEIDSTSANDGDMMVYVLCNPNMVIARESASKSIPNNGTYDTTLTFPSITISDITEAVVEFTAFSDGTGTAHARGALSAILTGTSEISTWVHRSGNTGTYQYGVVDLSGVDGTVKPIIQGLSTSVVPNGGASDLIITGLNFGTNTGSADVEISNNATYGAGTIVSQSIDSWADTSIQFDTVLTGISTDQTLYLWVTDSTGATGGSWTFYYGNPDFQTIVTSFLTTAPDHYWPMNNSLADIVGGATYDLGIRIGSPSFAAFPLVRGVTHTGYLSASGQGWDMADSPFMNLNTETARTVIMVIRLLATNKAIAAIDEEGGSVNNLMIQLAPGNILTCQFADTGDDNVHAYSDFKLKVNRTYLIGYSFDYGEGTPEFKQFIDGVEQSDSFGNPLTSTNLDAHSGNIAIGTPETSDEVFGTDVTFPNVAPMYISHKMSFTTKIPASEIKSKLVEQGMLADITISSDTEANMQTALDAYNNTERPDAVICIDIESCTDGNFTLSPTNLTFEDGATIHVRYIGGDTLTWANSNGGNAQQSLCVAPYGGTINVVEDVPIKVTVRDIDDNSVVENARILMKADIGGDLTEGVVVLTGLTNASGIATANLRYTSNQPVTGWIRKATTGTLYKTSPISATITSSGLDITIFMIKDE